MIILLFQVAVLSAAGKSIHISSLFTDLISVSYFAIGSGAIIIQLWENRIFYNRFSLQFHAPPYWNKMTNNDGKTLFDKFHLILL